MLYALHGFLGRPSDWTDLLKGSAFGRNLQSIDLFKDSPLPLSEWGKHFNEEAAKRDRGPRMLMGYSLGGRLALHALIQNPNLWDAAIIISAHAGLDLKQDKQQRRHGDEKWANRFEVEAWDGLMQAWNGRPVFDHDDFCFQRKESDYVRSRLAEALRVWSLGNQEYLLPSIEALDLPILWIVGEQDSFYAEQGKKVKLQHSGSRVWVASGAGHRVPWQQPEQFLGQVHDFIELSLRESKQQAMN